MLLVITHIYKIGSTHESMVLNLYLLMFLKFLNYSKSSKPSSSSSDGTAFPSVESGSAWSSVSS